MAVVVCAGVAVLFAHFDSMVADECAGISQLLTAVLLIWLAWQRFFGSQSGGEDASCVCDDAKPSPWFWAASAGALTAFAWLYLTQIFLVPDANPEAMDNPLAVALIEQARAAGRPANDFWAESPITTQWKEQDFLYQWQMAPGQRFKLQWMMQVQPLLNVCYVPFVKWIGLGPTTIVLYSTFFAIVAWLLTGVLAWRLTGHWPAVVAMTLMTSSLMWLIHVRVGYAPWMPSMALIVLLILILDAYCTKQGWIKLTLCGVLLGLLYLAGWIGVVFGVMITFWMIMLGGPRRLLTAIAHGTAVIGAGVVTVLVCTWLYAWRYGITVREILQAIWENNVGRYQQGEPGLLHLSISQRMAYACKCLFWDSRTLDGHIDKYLEGQPAVPWVFSAFLILGILYAIKARDRASKILLVWMLMVLVMVGEVFVFSHRYALLVLPAMSILAGCAVVQLGSDLRHWAGPRIVLPYGALVVMLMAGSLWSTHQHYYVQYLRHKEASFEGDRFRGHHAFVEWLNQTGTAADTLVVMSDPLTFPSTVFVFNTFGKDYAWTYWSRLFGTGSTSERLLDWEKEQFTKFRRIVYAFSSTLISDAQPGVFMNDPRPFTAAHPDARAIWTYAYDNRPPLILVFEIKR